MNEAPTADERRDYLIDKCEALEVRAYLATEAFAAVLELWRETREQLAFERSLLADVLREARTREMERMTGQAICRLLAETNGGPGLTTDELAEKLGHPRAVIRQEMAQLVLRKKVCTIDREGRYKMGPPPKSLFEVL